MLYAQMVLAGHVERRDGDYAAAQRVFRPDVYRAAPARRAVAGGELEGGIAGSMAVGTTEGRLILGADSFFDARSFDPDRLGEYLAGFAGSMRDRDLRRLEQ